MNRELNGRDDWVGQAEASNHDAESHCPYPGRAPHCFMDTQRNNL